MKIIRTIITLLLLLVSISNAQMNNMKVGLNGTLSVPIGDFNDLATMGFGFGGTFFYELADQFEVKGSLGYISWGGDEIKVVGSTVKVDGSFTSIPIMVGGRYILDGKEFNPYISGELGLHIFSTSDQENSVNGVVVQKVDGETELYLGFGFGGGVLYELSRDIQADASLQYNIISADASVNHFALQVGVNFLIN